MNETHYPEDEFDQIAKHLPQGAHRPGQPWWRGFLPFIIAIIVAPLLAWALLLLVNSHSVGFGQFSGEAPKASETGSQGEKTSQPADGGVDPADETGAGQEDSQSEETSSAPAAPSAAPSADSENLPANTEPAKTADKSSAISVLNASGINGLAALAKDRIAAKGYTKVTANNFTGGKPKQNTIFFSTDSALEAKEIQQVLRIDMIVERKDIKGVQVVLVKKF